MKTAEEVRYIEAAQRATEQAVAAAHDMLRQASINNGSSVVRWDTADVGASEEADQCKIDGVRLCRPAYHCCRGEQACDPHNEGSGPLPAHRSIIFDVFPRSATNRYFADMSRTVVRGTPSPDLKRLYQTVLDAQEEAITKVKDGADGKRIHQGILHAV